MGKEKKILKDLMSTMVPPVPKDADSENLPEGKWDIIQESTKKQLGDTTMRKATKRGNPGRGGRGACGGKRKRDGSGKGRGNNQERKPKSLKDLLVHMDSGGKVRVLKNDVVKTGIYTEPDTEHIKTMWQHGWKDHIKIIPLGDAQPQTNGKRVRSEYKGKPKVTKSVSFKRKKTKANAKTTTRKASKSKKFSFKGLGELAALPRIKPTPRANRIVNAIAKKREGKPATELAKVMKANLTEAKKAFDAGNKPKMDKHLAHAAGTRLALMKKSPKNKTLAKFAAYFESSGDTT